EQYKLMIEETLLAGRVQEAFDLYWFALGGFDNLLNLGENSRALRILERFIPRDDFTLIESKPRLGDRSALVSWVGGFAADLGDLDRARWAHAWSQRVNPEPSDYQNLANVE